MINNIDEVMFVFSFEKKIINYCEKYKFELFLLFIILATLYLRYVLIEFRSGDFEFYSSWLNYFKNNGG